MAFDTRLNGEGTFWKNIKSMGENLSDQAFDLNHNFKINDTDSQVLSTFYKQWSEYLTPHPHFFTTFLTIPEWFAKTFYGFSNALESIFNKIFALFGFFSLLGSNDNFIGQIYSGLRTVGISLFIAFIVVRVVIGIIGTPFKYKEFFNHAILVTAATAFLPAALTSFSEVVADSSKDLQTYVASGTKQGSTLSAQPFQDNVVDIMQLARVGFNASKLGRQRGDDGYINPSKAEANGVRLNRLSSKNIASTNFVTSYGPNDKEELEHFADAAKNKSKFLFFEIPTGDNENSMYYCLATLFRSELRKNDWDDSGQKPVEVEVAGYKVTSIVGYNILKPVYLRYKVNWIGLFVEQAMLILLLIGLLITVLQTIMRTLLSSVVAPIVGYTSVDNSAKFLDLLRTIFAGIAGIWFDILIVKYGLWFISKAPTMAFSSHNNNFGSFIGNLGFWGNTIATIALYIAVFYATIQGSRAIENWLGVSTGAKAGIAQTAATVGAGVMAGRAIEQASIGRKDINGNRHGGSIGHEMRNIRNAAQRGTKGVKDFGGSVLKNTAAEMGALYGSGSALRDNYNKRGGGLKGATFGTLDTLRNGAQIPASKFQSKGNAGVNALKDAYSSGKASAYSNFTSPSSRNIAESSITPEELASVLPTNSVNLETPEELAGGSSAKLAEDVSTKGVTSTSKEAVAPSKTVSTKGVTSTSKEAVAPSKTVSTKGVTSTSKEAVAPSKTVSTKGVTSTPREVVAPSKTVSTKGVTSTPKEVVAPSKTVSTKGVTSTPREVVAPSKTVSTKGVTSTPREVVAPSKTVSTKSVTSTPQKTVTKQRINSPHIGNEKISQENYEVNRPKVAKRLSGFGKEEDSSL
ncbi:hypothetical protein GPZ88_10105 (plasmid) [Streptococcus ruminicola]|uniref:DUF8208 domain-containing protein n=1 Tax=Streptococcus ruminicola TaxID=2686210 RepID=A0A6G8I2U7_9STRE|nr:hypothetical protein [Streptococcus ruminicola]QIM47419.1 hypothetical protein GPZ88_10105 [Streptococcus ruminicola]